ncbi:sensor histidine kinase [Anaerosacchariphilus polymeriproducens]|uniref:GHKL domain-containing protein n=1 Tax=Anaerosacchariphilus polymeriproducens TaxID=1812858 RepID=A0A371AWB0_9FIRM|nr:GHKL domain-containing protein [Anaerosacchariphilus polymeriproducens]RDU23857.1 GHKL domain-containing protein [Anaerosacchariphilus polymeriproducens]
MGVIVLSVIFIIELLKYWLSTSVYFTVEIRKKYVAIIGFIFFLFFLIGEKIKEDGIYFLMYSIVAVVLFVTIQESWKQKIKIILLDIVLITCLDELLGTLLENVCKKFSEVVLSSDISYLIGSSGSLFLIILIVSLKKKKLFRNAKLRQFAKNSVEVLMALMIFFLLFTVIGLNCAKEYVHKVRFILFANIVCIFSFFSIYILTGIMIYIKNTNKKMEELLCTERKLKNMQLNHYKIMLEKEEETRKYRHDMNNHLICLNELAHKGRIDLAIDYVESMQNHLSAVGKKVYQLGNEIIDAILNYYLPTLEGHVKLEIVGYFDEELCINNVELCTVFSNLIQNAVEEIKRCKSKEKLLRIEVKTGLEYLKIVIINSISADSLKKQNLLQTNKKDSLNHGFGLINVNETIQKNGGRFETKIYHNTFHVKVFLKL